MKLFCFPYAGGSATMYNQMAKKLKRNISLCPIDYAGNGKRVEEKFNDTFDELINDIEKQILPLIGIEKFAIFGYSMGGLVAYEISLRLCWKYKLPPTIIFFAACCPPHIPSEPKGLYLLEDDIFINELCKWGGVALELKNNIELLESFLPNIKNDFKLIHNYNDKKQMLPLCSDISIMYSDEERRECNIFDWGRYTNKNCSYLEFDGGHFFINSNMDDVVNYINQLL